MTDRAFDVLAVGNAIVDVLAHVEEDFLGENRIEKGAMTLIDEDRASGLYAKMPSSVEISGGSAANTAAGLAAFGAKVAYIGKTRNDQLGEVFAHDLRAIGVHYDTEQAAQGPATARCLILVTPDAQRSMNTFLGVSSTLSPADIDFRLVEAAKVTYLEGYLYDMPAAKEAFHVAAEHAKKAGNKVSLTLSDGFCVDRYREEFRRLVDHHIDILFANEAEIKSLFETDDFDEAAASIRDLCDLVALTRSEKGSVILTPHEVHRIAPETVDELVDTTGAGDQYAAGFLYGFTRALDLASCGRLGSLAAAEIISHFGARPEVSLKELARKAKIIP